MKRTLSLFDTLVKSHPNCYIKINDNYIPSLREIYDFEIVKNIEKYGSSFKIPTFEWQCESSCTECGNFSIKKLPVIFTLEGVDTGGFDLLKYQLLTEEVPKFENIDQQIDYILILEQLTMGNYNEINKYIKDITFNPDIYYHLTDFNVNLSNYGNGKTEIIIKSLIRNCGVSEIIKENPVQPPLSIFRVREYERPRNELPRECRFGSNCLSFHVPNYRCRFNHSTVKQNDPNFIFSENDKLLFTKLMNKLQLYDIFLIGHTDEKYKNKFDLPFIPINKEETMQIGLNESMQVGKFYFEHKFHNIDIGKIYDCMEINKLVFICNPHYSKIIHDKRNKVIAISNTYQYFKIYTPVNCGYNCGRDYPHRHGN